MSETWFKILNFPLYGYNPNIINWLYAKEPAAMVQDSEPQNCHPAVARQNFAGRNFGAMIYLFGLLDKIFISDLLAEECGNWQVDCININRQTNSFFICSPP